MGSNNAAQGRINAQNEYRRKLTITLVLSVILLILILVGLVKVILDEKKAQEGNKENNKVAETLTPGVLEEDPAPGEDNTEPAEPVGDNEVTIPKRKVAVDPGHGGPEDFGSDRPAEGLFEKDATLAISLFLKEELEAAGYEVFMIRETDIAVDKKDRPVLAKESGADIYVSIHLNSLENDSDSTMGAEVWYSNLRNNDSDVLSQYVVDELTSVINTRNRGIKLGNELAVLKNNELPACLVECGFMSSATERAKLFDTEYQKLIAKGVANGIKKFLPLE